MRKKDLARKLEQLEADLEQFSYITSHDLREPLTAVAGYATLLQRRCGDNLSDSGKHFLDEIIAATKRMECKIDDLLAFSRAGRATVESTFCLGAALDEARRAMVRRIEHTGAQILAPENLPTIRGDRSMIAQVFQNLLSNSLKYKGEETPRIEVSAERSDKEWTISVKDNGIGFDMTHGQRIFGVFQRLYTVEEYPGTGIGLAIVKRIIERHGGRIWAESEPGQGATFRFTLPASD